MDRAEIDQLVARLVENPHDEDALAYAHQAGEADPKAYAMMLERIGSETRDPAYAAHWLAEAANVWSTTLGDAHRAARVLMMAIDKDPTAQVAAERLAQLYREKGDTKALVALLDRRAKAMAPLAAQQPELRSELAGMHEELGRLWSEPPLSQPKKAIESYKRAIELDPESAYAIFNARELFKQTQQWSEAIPLYAAELELERDPARRVGLLRDEAATRKLAGDLPGATRALAAARELDGADPTLQQEFASSVLDRIQAGEAVPAEERSYAAERLVALAEAYEGEHGLAYAGAALDIEPGNDRGVQLYAHYARSLGQEQDAPLRYDAYLQANPGGAMASELRAALGDAGQHLQLASLTDERPAQGESPEETRDRPLTEEPAHLTAQRTAAQERKRPSTAPAATVPSSPPSTVERPDVEALDASHRRGQALSPEMLQGILDAAQMLAGKGKKPEALAKYKEVLESDPAHPEALAWSEEHLRAKRDYGQLRDVLLASIRATPNVPEHHESRMERLREVAGLCEGNLRDVDGAIAAWRQLLSLDRKDESARTALMRLLEKSQRWDELATLLEQEATIESDVDTKVQLEKKLAKLQEDKRKDLVGAAEAWARIARVLGDDDQALLTSSRLFERGDRADLAAGILAEGAPSIEDPVARGGLMQRLGELRERLGEVVAAGDSYAEAADALHNGKLWEESERLYSSADVWDRAAHAAYQRGLLAGDLKQQALCLARAADFLTKAGDPDEALARLEEATDLDPLNDDYANLLVTKYNQGDQIDELVAFLTKRGDRLTDRIKRVNVRREAAALATTRTQDNELARELWLKLLEDGDDKEALERLIDDAVEREDHTEAATLLRRLGQNTVDKAEKARVALREAEMLADGVGDVDTAISRYELILTDLDPTCRPALQAIADLQEARGALSGAADALERELKLVADVLERGQIAARLARLYEKLDDPRNAIRALDLVRKADLEDFDALTSLCELCEVTEQWGRLAELLADRIEIEADQQEIVALTKKLAMILASKLDRGDEALGALTDLADQGETSIREAYIELGDGLGWKGIVASKLKEWWFDARHGPERTAALRGAFERFAEVGRDADAVAVAIELVRTKGADGRLAARLEELAVKTSDVDALTTAHDLLAREKQGPERAFELVRQAEVRARAGVAKSECLTHGEQGLPSIPPGEAEPLLDRLAALASKPVEIVDLYERQVVRSKQPQDRVRALARAAQIASTRGQPERARGFFELALSAAPSDETLAVLETAAREGDRLSGGDRLRRVICAAMAAGGHGARDGGRTRANLLRRAATIARRDLNDVEQAFSWLGDALVAHVDPLTLDMLEALGLECGDPRRSEAALTHALSEVFDGPLVRQLLGRRAKIRRDQLVEPVNAAADLKKLHDLSPTDQAVMDELAGLYMDLYDYKSLVQLYEDQILRGKDASTRAELARKVARIWEEQLADAREAADGWRRVLRMKAGDPEATSGLERTKSSDLKKPEGDPKFVYAPPKLVTEAAAPPRASAAPPPHADVGPRSPSGPPKRPSASRVKSVPPPLPPKTGKPSLASSDARAAAALDAPGLADEIDAQFDRLALEPSPAETGAALGARSSERVEPNASPPTKQSARPSGPASPAAAESTVSAPIAPQTERGSAPSSAGPSTERPDGASSAGGFHTRPHEATGGGSITSEQAIVQDLESGDLLDVDDAETTGTDMTAPLDLESTNAGAKDDDEIVIADDLAELVDESAKRLPSEEEEHTDADGTLPPER